MEKRNVLLPFLAQFGQGEEVGEGQGPSGFMPFLAFF